MEKVYPCKIKNMKSYTKILLLYWIRYDQRT